MAGYIHGDERLPPEHIILLCARVLERTSEALFSVPDVSFGHWESTYGGENRRSARGWYDLSPPYIVITALILSSSVFWFAGDDTVLMSRVLGTLEHPPSALIDEVSSFLIKLCASHGAHHPTDHRSTQPSITVA